MPLLLRDNLGLLISLGLLAGGLLVCTTLGLFMARAGASLRPIFWFAGFFSLILLPQVLGHLHKALTRAAPAALQESSSLVSSPEPRASSEGATTAPPASNHTLAPFGSDADPGLITDVRQAYGEVFREAESARFALLPDGDTVLLAHFNGSMAAEKAWVAYLRVSGLSQLGGKGDSQRGYLVTRPVGDKAYVLHTGRMLGIWTGRDDSAIQARMEAGGFEAPHNSPLSEHGQGHDSALSAPRTGGQGRTSNSWLLGAALLGYTLLVVLYFFKGAAWAGTSNAKPGVEAVPAHELAARLLGLKELDIPFHLEAGAQPNEYYATWRYADAKWVDLARARGMKRSFRIRLLLDEQTRTVRATDYFTTFDWSAGRTGAELSWKAGLGIVFFQYEHQRVFGLQIDEQGRPTPKLDYAYTFKLDEMKAPLIDVTTRSGWQWRPTVWEGPRWLGWLTQ